MILHPLILEEQSEELFSGADCQKLFKTYVDYYARIGYHPPWTGYFVIRDNVVVGCCGFTGQPVNGKVEVAYFTFKEFEGQGVASFSCRQLVSIARQEDPSLVITAKTLPEKNASTAILERNGFVFSGFVNDVDEGEVWEWTWQPSATPTI